MTTRRSFVKSLLLLAAAPHVAQSLLESLKPAQTWNNRPVAGTDLSMENLQAALEKFREYEKVRTPYLTDTTIWYISPRDVSNARFYWMSRGRT